MKLEKVTLDGSVVRMLPLELAHLDALCEVGLDEDIWRWSPDPITTRDQMRAYVESALTGAAKGACVPFATTLRDGGKVIGCTRFGNIDTANLRAEIGWTWIGRDWQRTAVNTEAKYLMLKHAFEVWLCNRVELKTDVLNDRSRNAILRIGAIYEGIFRRHVVTASGRIRDSVYFSIIREEWPEVKQRLEARLVAVP